MLVWIDRCHMMWVGSHVAVNSWSCRMLGRSLRCFYWRHLFMCWHILCWFCGMLSRPKRRFYWRNLLFMCWSVVSGCCCLRWRHCKSWTRFCTWNGMGRCKNWTGFRTGKRSRRRWRAGTRFCTGSCGCWWCLETYGTNSTNKEHVIIERKHNTHPSNKKIGT